MDRRTFLAAAPASIAAPAAIAAPRYALDTAASVVAFGWTLAGVPYTGRMPILSAELALDLRDLPASTIDVALDATGTRSGFALADPYLKGPVGLASEAHPVIRYRSRGYEGGFEGGTVRGALTLRGVTRPVTKTATIRRQAGSAAGDISRLSVRLGGTVARADFGVVAFPDLVGPTISFDILARIARV
ncbi:MAG: YceI family protein [Shimia sp.]